MWMKYDKVVFGVICYFVNQFLFENSIYSMKVHYFYAYVMVNIYLFIYVHYI